MSHGWTPERRRKQSEAIQRWRPWEKTTGPRTIKGKAVLSVNAVKHGMRSAGNREMERLIAQLSRIERGMREEISLRCTARYLLPRSMMFITNVEKLLFKK
jgi:hypothetical protein